MAAAEALPPSDGPHSAHGKTLSASAAAFTPTFGMMHPPFAAPPADVSMPPMQYTFAEMPAFSYGMPPMPMFVPYEPYPQPAPFFDPAVDSPFANGMLDGPPVDVAQPSMNPLAASFNPSFPPVSATMSRPPSRSTSASTSSEQSPITPGLPAFPPPSGKLKRVNEKSYAMMAAKSVLEAAPKPPLQSAPALQEPPRKKKEAKPAKKQPTGRRASPVEVIREVPEPAPMARHEAVDDDGWQIAGKKGAALAASQRSRPTTPPEEAPAVPEAPVTAAASEPMPSENVADVKKTAQPEQTPAASAEAEQPPAPPAIEEEQQLEETSVPVEQDKPASAPSEPVQSAPKDSSAAAEDNNSSIAETISHAEHEIVDKVEGLMSEVVAGGEALVETVSRAIKGEDAPEEDQRPTGNDPAPVEDNYEATNELVDRIAAIEKDPESQEPEPAATVDEPASASEPSTSEKDAASAGGPVEASVEQSADSAEPAEAPAVEPATLSIPSRRPSEVDALSTPSSSEISGQTTPRPAFAPVASPSLAVDESSTASDTQPVDGEAFAPLASSSRHAFSQSTSSIPRSSQHADLSHLSLDSDEEVLRRDDDDDDDEEEDPQPPKDAQEPPSLTMSIFSQSRSLRDRLWAILGSVGINVFLPFVNGVMLGFGEIFAREYLALWTGVRAPAARLVPPPTASTANVGLRSADRTGDMPSHAGAKTVAEAAAAGAVKAASHR